MLVFRGVYKTNIQKLKKVVEVSIFAILLVWDPVVWDSTPGSPNPIPFIRESQESKPSWPQTTHVPSAEG